MNLLDFVSDLRLVDDDVLTVADEIALVVGSVAQGSMDSDVGRMTLILRSKLGDVVDDCCLPVAD